MFSGTNQRVGEIERNQQKAGADIQALEQRCAALEKRAECLEALLNGYENVLINIRNNNAQIAALEQSMETMAFKVKRLKKREKANLAPALATASDTKQILDVRKDCQHSEDSYTSIDYFDFENHFRGDKNLIKERQKQYLPYFKDCKSVVDIGCGRGEFLQLLAESQINAVGVDTYEEFVDFCQEQGLKAVCDDGNHYLYNIEHTDGIFVGQVVEHMTTEQIIDLCNIAWEKLEDGGYLIIETPNPTSLAIYTHAFYIDPSHEKPVHPLTMEYFLKKAGFREINVIYTECSKLDQTIPRLGGANIENLEPFNDAMQIVSDTLFGSQDYAIIAKKQNM